jgi:hypothetical protein
MAEWFVVRKGKEHGPFQDAQLKSLATSGKLKEEDQVRRSDQKSTVAAKSIGGLFGPALSLESPPPAPAPAPAAASKKSGLWMKVVYFLMFCVMVGQVLKMIGTMKGGDAEAEATAPTVAVKGTRDQPESLTADFLPHRAGLRQQRLTTAMLGLPMESQSRREYVHDGRGTITVNTLSNFYTKNRGAKPPQQTPKKEHYKIEDGFVCVGTEQIGNTIDWRKVMKLGAVQGDTWEDDGSGSPTRYEVVSFEKKAESMRELAPKGWQWVATIQSSEMLGDKEYQITYLFAHGVGLIEKHVYEGSGGTSVKRSDEVLVPAIKE